MNCSLFFFIFLALFLAYNTSIAAILFVIVTTSMFYLVSAGLVLCSVILTYDRQFDSLLTGLFVYFLNIPGLVHSLPGFINLHVYSASKEQYFREAKSRFYWNSSQKLGLLRAIIRATWKRLLVVFGKLLLSNISVHYQRLVFLTLCSSISQNSYNYTAMLILCLLMCLSDPFKQYADAELYYMISLSTGLVEDYINEQYLMHKHDYDSAEFDVRYMSSLCFHYSGSLYRGYYFFTDFLMQLVSCYFIAQKFGLMTIVLVTTLIVATTYAQNRLNDYEKSLYEHTNELPVDIIVSNLRTIKQYAWENNLKVDYNLPYLPPMVVRVLRGIVNRVVSYGPKLITISLVLWHAKDLDGLPYVELSMLLYDISSLLSYMKRLEDIPLIIDKHMRLENYMKRWVDFEYIKKQPYSTIAINLNQCMFSWKEFSLKPISLKIDQGMFVTVVGKVGSGKSSFLSALCGEMPLTSGTGAINGSIGYVSQKPWIMNATIKDNILFGNKYEQAKYIRIIHACALTEDLEQLPHKDMTEIGRQGINLSGGQKARLALARAIYNDADIYILDDILAAVDAQVEKHIIDNVLLGIIKDNTRILVTHSKHVVPLSDINIVVDNGNLSVSQAMAVFEKKETLAEPDADIITDEEVEKYNYNPPLVPYSTFTLMRMFIKLSGYGLVALVMLMQLTRIGGQMYLMNMKMRLLSSADVNISRYLISDLIFDILLQELEKQVEIVQETYWFRKVNKEMKRILIESLMQAKLTVIERLSKSRLVKLFNWNVLEIAAFGARQFTAKTYGIIQSCAFIVSAIYSSPEILVIIMAVHLSFALLARLVGNTSSESVEYNYDGDLKDEILDGHEIIRVHNKVDVFSAKLTQIQINDILNKYNRQISSIFANAAYLVKKTIITLVVLLQTPYYSQNGNFIEHIVNLTDGIYENFSNVINGDGSFQGFEDSARSYFTFTGTLDKENCNVSQSKPPNWPQQGIVEFKNYSLQYRPDLPLVLQNLSFTTKPGEKIGIVGRTGAGKSSLTFALLRLVEAAQGSIYIDGIDISTIGLHDLRSSIAMVPQDPMILPGTIRDNLDPGNEYNDAAIQLALEKTGIWPWLDDQLDTWVDGTRFSAGQRQLLSLSRALLWNRKIVILDEATANIDSHTDQLIQQLIRQEFAHSTVLTIAHRLNTVMDSDRILVMNQGHVVEFDTPQALLQQPGSLFKQMLDSLVKVHIE